MKYRVVYRLKVSQTFYGNFYNDVELASTEKANEATFKSKIGLSDNYVILSWSKIEE